MGSATLASFAEGNHTIDRITESASSDAVQLSSEQFQAIARTLADPRRFAMLQQIAASESMLCSCLDVQASISPATISHHLRELQEAGLVEAQRQGRSMCLSLRRPVWNAYIRQLQAL